MSRIGKLPLPLPSGVTVKLEGQKLTVKGSRGTLTRELHPDVDVAVENNQILVSRRDDQRQNRALHGLTRALLANMVKGVDEGFRRSMEIVGVGYKVEARDKALVFSVGYSHPVMLQPPPGITFEVEKPTIFHISGADKELVGQVAAKARAIRPPDAYKGKGVRYSGETIKLKAGKTSK